MGATFRFCAKKAKTGEAVKVEVHVGGVNCGYTPNTNNDWLVVEKSQTGSYSWFAKYDGKNIQSGKSDGGSITIIVD